MVFCRLSLLVAICAFASVAVASPSMPMGFEAQMTNATGRTWRETGILAQPYAMAKASVRSSMLGQGYGIVHDIDEGPNATRSLQLWRRRDEDVILMLWQEDLYTTGVAWGLSARGGEETAEASHTEVSELDSRAEPAEIETVESHVESAEKKPRAEGSENAGREGGDGFTSRPESKESGGGVKKDEPKTNKDAWSVEPPMKDGFVLAAMRWNILTSFPRSVSLPSEWTCNPPCRSVSSHIAFSRRSRMSFARQTTEPNVQSLRRTISSSGSCRKKYT